MNEIESLFVNSISAIAVTAIFIWFLAKVIIPYIAAKDLRMKEIISEFNITIQHQLEQANQVIKDNTIAHVRNIETIDRLAKCIDQINRKTRKG